MKKFAAAAIFPAMLLLQPAVANDDLLILEDRIADLEQQIDNQVKVAGYVDVEYVDSTKTGDNPGIRMHHLSLFFKQQISEDWRFFSEIEYEDAPLFEGRNDPSDLTLKKSEGKIYAEAINLDYTMRPDLNFRMGRFFTPAGIWSIDHYPPYVPTQERPMHNRKIFPQLVDGLMAFGGKPVRSSFLNYNVYLGNGEGNPGRQAKA